jgi:hypothetical protein
MEALSGVLAPTEVVGTMGPNLLVWLGFQLATTY